MSDKILMVMIKFSLCVILKEATDVADEQTACFLGMKEKLVKPVHIHLN
jgi:hypothetical protein